jgi:hypothetical protein
VLGNYKSGDAGGGSETQRAVTLSHAISCEVIEVVVANLRGGLQHTLRVIGTTVAVPTSVASELLLLVTAVSKGGTPHLEYLEIDMPTGTPL